MSETARPVHDHFAGHKHLAEGGEERIDLNFNLYPGEHPQVAALAQAHRGVLAARSGELYTPIPDKWLHSTILRVGLVQNFTPDQVRDFIETLKPRLAALKMPDLTIGLTPAEAKGDIILRIQPEEAVRELHALIAEVTGVEPNPNFIAHMTLAYSKDRIDDGQLAAELEAIQAQPATFRPNLWVVEQRVTEDGYIYREPRIAHIGLGRAAIHLADNPQAA